MTGVDPKGLLPCPMCGFSAHARFETFFLQIHHFGECQDADCMTRGPLRLTKAEAIENWNRRAALTPLKGAPASTPPATKGVTEAATALVQKLNLIHADHKYQNVWALSHFHNGPYTGPQYDEELAALETALASLPAPGAGGPTEVSIKPMTLSDDRCDYFVSFKHGDREVTPHVFRERFKAEYHVALYRWLFGQTSEEPRVVEFGPEDWPAREYTVDEQRAFAALSPTAPELGAVKVKPIEWVRRPIIGGEDRIMSYDGYYWLSRASDGFMVIGEDGIGHAQRLSGTVYPTEDAAQAAAQQHFESRILSALVRPATQNDQPETDEMQPDRYTGGDFNGVVRGKRP